MSTQPSLSPISIDDFRAPNRRIWDIAGPAMLANISAPLVGLVDTWAIGHLPDPKHLAAIGVGATIFTFMLWSFGFLRMGTTSLIARSVGRGNESEVASHSARALLVALILGLIILITGVFWPMYCKFRRYPRSLPKWFEIYISWMN